MTFEPTLESVSQHQLPDWFAKAKLPDWFAKAKLGIFIHWGLFSVPAWAPPGDDIDRQVAEKGWQAMFANNPYAEWYQNSLRVGDTPTRRRHAEVYGADFAYEDFAATFNEAVQGWNPDDWAELFSRVGARYVVLTTKHHEGFLLWPSPNTSPKRPPGFACPRDLVGDLTTAVRRHGLRLRYVVMECGWACTIQAASTGPLSSSQFLTSTTCGARLSSRKNLWITSTAIFGN